MKKNPGAAARARAKRGKKFLAIYITAVGVCLYLGQETLSLHVFAILTVLREAVDSVGLNL